MAIHQKEDVRIELQIHSKVIWSMSKTLTYTLMVCRSNEPELYHFDNYALAIGVFKEWCDLLQIRKRDFVQGYFGEQIIWAEEDNKSVSLIPNII